MTTEKDSILTDMTTVTSRDCESKCSSQIGNDEKATFGVREGNTDICTDAYEPVVMPTPIDEKYLDDNNKNCDDSSKTSSATTSETTTSTMTTGFRIKIQSKQARKRKRQLGCTASNKDVFGVADNEITNTNILLLSADEISNSNKVGENDADDNDSNDMNIHKHSITGKVAMSLSSGSSSAPSSDDGDNEDTSSVATVRTSNVENNDTTRRKNPQHEKVQNDETNKTSTTKRQKNNDKVDDDVEHKKQKNRHNGNGDGDDQTNKTFKMDDDKGLVDSKHKGETDRVGQIQSEIQPKQLQQQQPEGWRVKLYRLNADGSWDDCGTGRILCLYKPKPSKESDDNCVPSTGDNDNKNNKTNSENSSSSSSSNLTAAVSDSSVYQELGEPTLCMHSEISSAATTSSSIQQQQPSLNNNNNNNSSTNNPRILLRTRILLRDAYQRQGDNIITWCEPYLEEGNPAQGVDLALSFQDNSGCIDIWRQITDVQSKASERFRSESGITGNSDGGCNNIIAGGNDNDKNNTAGTDNVVNGGFLADLAHNAAAAHHANNLLRQELWVNVPADGILNQGNNNNSNNNNNNNMNGDSNDETDQFEDAMGGMAAAYHDSVSPSGGSSALNTPTSPQLPNPPTLGALEEIADTISGVQNIQQRESLAMYIAQNDCYYLKSLLSLFPPAEERGDYGSLATLAACVKTILLLNDPSIIELIVTDELVFEDICSTLEYDPDLRDKANHRWFLQERAKFRTVAIMEDEELVCAIHRSFRVNYLKDILLRPTMDESSLSTLSSLQTFTHADVVKGVTMSSVETDDRGDLLRDSYLAKVIRILGHEMDEICELEWRELEVLESEKDVHFLLAKRHEESPSDSSTVIASGKYPQSPKMSTIWKQHLAPQDSSMVSRRIRKRGSLSFLRELFNMVRISLHQTDKDDFFAVLVSMEVDLSYEKKSQNQNLELSFNDRKDDTDNSINEQQDIRTPEDTKENPIDSKGAPPEKSSKPVNFLLLLATVLSDPETDVTDKGLVLEIIAGIAMHDPSLIRRKCLDFYASCKGERPVASSCQEMTILTRPRPNEKKQVIFQCPPNDLLASLLFLLATEIDAGVLLQVSEIMRIILDTDVMGDNNRPMNTGFADEAEGIPPSRGHNPPHDQHPNPTGSGNTASTEQNQFLLVFYDHYVQWLAAPFQYTILYPLLRFPTAVFIGRKKSHISDIMLQRFEKGAYHEEPLLHKVPFSALRSSFAVELLSFCVRAHQYRMKTYLLRSRVLGNVLKLIKPSSLPRSISGDRCLKLAALRFLRAVLSVDEDSYHLHIIQDDLFGPVFETFRANPVGDNLVSSSIVEMCDFINSKNISSLIEYIVTKHLSVTDTEAPVPSLEDVSSPYVNTLTCLRHAYEKLLHDKRNVDQNNEKQSIGLTNIENHGRVVMNEKALEDQRKFREVDQEESYFDCDDEPSIRTPRILSQPQHANIKIDESKISDKSSDEACI